jgi:hopanoid biosynthesis associated protein HpnK
MAARRLIVHADDFGLSERVNEGIVEAHRDGILTSTSVIASGAAFEHAIALSRATPTLDMGVHLTLVDEEPVSAADAIPTLLDTNGHFYRRTGTFMKRYLFGTISLDEIGRELDAQIGKVIAHRVKVTHLDGHQHLHMVAGIRRVVGRLARKYAIPSIRYPKEALQLYMLHERESLVRVPQLLVLNTFCTFARTADAKRPDHFCGFFYGGRLTKENLIRVLRHLPATGTSELMCHPGLSDPDSRYAHWGYRWQDERDALIGQEIKDYLNSHRIDLISYADLHAQETGGYVSARHT